MMNDNEPKPKSLCGLFDNSFQLVLGHFMVRLVIDTFNFAAILDWSDYAPEINNGARAGYVAHPRLKRRLCHQNFANDICHALKLLATVTPSALSSHKRRYKNEYESM
jgi:aminopeptidase-like protein